MMATTDADMETSLNVDTRENSISRMNSDAFADSISPTGSMKRSKSRFHRTDPFLIGVAGGTASGKTTVCDEIMQRLHDQCVVMLSQDSFYRCLTEEEKKNVKGKTQNFVTIKL